MATVGCTKIFLPLLDGTAIAIYEAAKIFSESLKHVCLLFAGIDAQSLSQGLFN